MRNPFAVGPGALARLSTTRLGGEDRALLAAGLHSRRLVLLKSLQRRTEAGDTPPGERAEFARHWRVLEDAERCDPAAVRAVLGYPSVGVWLVDALEAPGPVGPRTLAHFGAVAAAAALRARAGYRGTLDTPDGVLALPGIGVYRTRAPRVRLVAGPRSLRLTPEDGRPHTVPYAVPGQAPYAYGGGPAPDGTAPPVVPNGTPYGGGPRGRAPYGPYGRAPYGRTVSRRAAPRAAPPGWSGLVPLPGTGAALDGIDPYRLPAPDSGPFSLLPPRRAPRPGAGEERWRRRWQAALTLLASADPGRALEVAALVRALVPLEPGPGGASSATLRAAPWAVFTACPPTALRLAEVLVHEIQHSKLAIVTDLVALYEGGDEPVHRVGWRPDPRPLAGVLQGTYAHLGLADLFHRLAARPGAAPAARRAARVRGDECREQVADALRLLLRSGQLTPAGKEFAIGMREHHTDLGRIGTAGDRTARRILPIRYFR
ncbi:hypothetical protein GCM10009801_23540 [Streptomyces albiaxialis]|uniref:HEXXH motif domain-containing protein n=1 Tax=Streptomyces albiaxialis TaxID=329523 RepID=A0ABP5HH77_9ACTN